MTICEYAVSKRERIINSKKSIEEMEIKIKRYNDMIKITDDEEIKKDYKCIIETYQKLIESEKKEIELMEEK